MSGFQLCIAAYVVGSAACAYEVRELRLPADEGDGDVDLTDGDPFSPLDFDGSAWVDAAPTNSPGQRWGVLLAYHRDRRSVMFYGAGSSASGPTAELWELRGGAWSRLCEACPPGALHWPAFVYDTWRKRLVLFGGNRGDRFSTELTGATWIMVDGEWTQLPAAGPGPRWATGAAFDERRGVLVVFGGEGPEYEVLGDLWELHGDTWLGPITVPGGPPARTFPGRAYSARLGATLFFGGYPFSDDLWSWSGTSWSLLCSACSGVPRAYAGLIHLREGPLLLIGGWTGNAEIAGTRTFENEVFVPLLEGPSARDSMGVAYDELNRRVVIFGGNGVGCGGGGDCAETLFLTIPSE